MRCEHMVEPRLKWFRIRTDCGRLLYRVDSRLILGGCRWHVYRCRLDHETRVLVGTDSPTGPSGQYADGR